MPRKKPARVSFGRRVRQLRADAGYSQEDFAHHAGIDRSYFGQIERGEVNVSIDLIETIARGLKVDIAELFDWDSS